MYRMRRSQRLLKHSTSGYRDNLADTEKYAVFLALEKFKDIRFQRSQSDKALTVSMVTMTLFWKDVVLLTAAVGEVKTPREEL